MNQQTSIEFPSERFALDPDELPPKERAVYVALRRGRPNARRVPDIAAAAGLSPRETQTVIERLILDHGVPIGSAMGKPAGNYLIDSPEDLDATAGLLRSRAIHVLRRVAALQQMTFERLMAEIQTELLEPGDDREAA